MPRPKVRKLSKKEAKFQQKRRDQLAAQAPVIEVVEKPQVKVVELSHVIPVRRFAELTGVPVIKVIQTLLKNGIRATINESIDFDTASIIGDELNLEIRPLQATAAKKPDSAEQKNLVTRPPIVTVMGHVDHGKTKLLDAIRKTNVAEKESGGITQHIGAYQVDADTKDGKRSITFLDTPGHEAFSSLRAHGATITDIVILVVAADDGIKPQTLEALSHARAANVPIIVALNKIDLPQADPERVKRQLAEQNLLPEQWGGKTPVVEVSAKAGKNIDQLLEVTLLTSDLNPLQADPTVAATGAIVEAHMDAAGPLVTALVTQGTLKTSDPLNAGRAWGKVRFLQDWQGRRIAQATPGMPVVVAGLRSLPEFGDVFTVTSTEQEAKQKAQAIGQPAAAKVAAKPDDVQTRTLSLVVKADVSASLEAISSTIKEMGNQNVAVLLTASGIGPVSESDVTMAAATGSLIVAFRVPVAQNIQKLASSQHVEIKRYEIIYQLIDDVRAALKKLIEPEIIKKITGRLIALEVFMQAKDTALIGGRVTEGELRNGQHVMVEESGSVIGEGKITSLQVNKEAKTEATKGQECGLRLAKTSVERYKIKPKAIIVGYVTQKAPSE